MKRCFISLAIRETQIKTTVSITPHTPEWVKSKDSNKCWQGWGESEPSHLLVGKQTVQLLWATVWQFLKKRTVTLWPSYSDPLGKLHGEPQEA